MTRLTVHALSADGLVVCGDDGRRWVLGAPASAIGSDAVRQALDEIRASGSDREVPIGNDLVVDSVADLRRLATAPDIGQAVDASQVTDVGQAVLFRYAGRVHRVRLDPPIAPSTIDRIEGVLRARVHDPQMAETFTAPPLLADPLVLAAASRPTPEVDTIERWDGEVWTVHRLTPAPALDPLTGIVQRIVTRPVEPWHPAGFVHLHAELPHLASIDASFQPDALAPAGAFTQGPRSPEETALLSGVAHYCGAYLGQGELRRDSARRLRASGARVLTVADWRPHDPDLHDLAGFPFVRDDPDGDTWWLAGEEGGATCWVPLALVHAGYLSSGLVPLPATNSHNLVGLQAGRDLHAAAESAAAHIVAHDAVARWWRDPAPLPTCELPRVLRRGGARHPLDFTVLAVPSRTGVPVRLVVVDDRRADIVSLGFAAAADPEEAAGLAAADALVQHASARDLDSPNSLIRDAETIGNGGVAGLAPFDADRRYDVGAFADPRRLTDPMCHVQYGLSPSSVARVRRRTAGRGTEAETSDGRSPLSALGAADTRVVIVDVTTPRVREAGYAACRLLAPGFERLTPAAFPAHLDGTPPYPGW